MYKSERRENHTVFLNTMRQLHVIHLVSHLFFFRARNAPRSSARSVQNKKRAVHFLFCTLRVQNKKRAVYKIRNALRVSYFVDYEKSERCGDQSKEKSKGLETVVLLTTLLA
jgi:hypothetical protein